MERRKAITALENEVGSLLSRSAGRLRVSLRIFVLVYFYTLSRRSSRAGTLAVEVGCCGSAVGPHIDFLERVESRSDDDASISASSVFFCGLVCLQYSITLSLVSRDHDAAVPVVLQVRRRV